MRHAWAQSPYPGSGGRTEARTRQCCEAVCVCPRGTKIHHRCWGERAGARWVIKQGASPSTGKGPPSWILTDGAGAEGIPGEGSGVRQGIENRQRKCLKGAEVRTFPSALCGRSYSLKKAGREASTCTADLQAEMGCSRQSRVWGWRDSPFSPPASLPPAAPMSGLQPRGPDERVWFNQGQQRKQKGRLQAIH